MSSGGRAPSHGATERSIAVVVDFEEGKRAQHIGCGSCCRRMYVGSVKLGKSVGPKQAKAALDLVFQEFEQSHDAGLAGGGERVALHAANPDQVRTGDDCLDDVAAAAERSVDHDLGAPGDGVDDFGQHIHGAATMIELAAAVIRYVNPVDAMLDRELGILGSGNALERERDLEPLLDALDCAPIKRRLEAAAGNAAPTGGLGALGDVALAPAVDRGVNGKAECQITVVDRATYIVVDGGVVAANG